MNVVFRADASLNIGNGHVMRCLVLADEISRQGARCVFVCRRFEGHLFNRIQERGHELRVLPVHAPAMGPFSEGTVHAAWLGVDQSVDVLETLESIADLEVDWIVVDHYGVDARWERRARSSARRIMVIDDLADRIHDCDLLLDQNLGRGGDEYRELVPGPCIRLLGPGHALLAPMFAQARANSLERRSPGRVERILVTMGGVDKDDVTGWLLRVMDGVILSIPPSITVVMGPNAPWVEQVRLQAASMRWPVEVLVDVNDMARLMTNADLAIGAAGSTSWERCCLGLPSVVMVLAENQRAIAAALGTSGAARVVDHGAPGSAAIFGRTLVHLCSSPSELSAMSRSASAITDGLGARRVVEQLFR